MANQNFTQLVALVEDYLRDSTAYSTQIGYFINWLCEKLATEYNFSYHILSYDDTLSAAAYQINYPTRCSQIIAVRWYLANADHGIITYKSPRQFIRDHGYIDSTAAGAGTPRFYTIVGSGTGTHKITFNRDADQEYKVRIWYTELPPTLSGTVSHEFYPDWLGTMAIVSGVLFEIKDMVSLDRRGEALAKKHQYYRDLLISSDSNKADEPFRVEAYFDSNMDEEFEGGGIDPYDWV